MRVIFFVDGNQTPYDSLSQSFEWSPNNWILERTILCACSSVTWKWSIFRIKLDNDGLHLTNVPEFYEVPRPRHVVCLPGSPNSQRIELEVVPDVVWEHSIGKSRTVERVKLLFEDLIARTWHPDRFESWCLDEDDKKEAQFLMDD